MTCFGIGFDAFRQHKIDTVPMYTRKLIVMTILVPARLLHLALWYAKSHKIKTAGINGHIKWKLDNKEISLSDDFIEVKKLQNGKHHLAMYDSDGNLIDQVMIIGASGSKRHL